MLVLTLGNSAALCLRLALLTLADHLLKIAAQKKQEKEGCARSVCGLEAKSISDLTREISPSVYPTAVESMKSIMAMILAMTGTGNFIRFWCAEAVYLVC